MTDPKVPHLVAFDDVDGSRVFAVLRELHHGDAWHWERDATNAHRFDNEAQARAWVAGREPRERGAYRVLDEARTPLTWQEAALGKGLRRP